MSPRSITLVLLGVFAFAASNSAVNAQPPSPEGHLFYNYDGQRLEFASETDGFFVRFSSNETSKRRAFERRNAIFGDADAVDLPTSWTRYVFRASLDALVHV